ncbi:hypothetical protein EDB86DRAFT_2276309 [Lactarius hatsudake]|nr:hypothetical protein EDB86DRAFT_2276309 [Lactarius hatsudake]
MSLTYLTDYATPHSPRRHVPRPLVLVFLVPSRSWSNEDTVMSGFLTVFMRHTCKIVVRVGMGTTVEAPLRGASVVPRRNLVTFATFSWT